MKDGELYFKTEAGKREIQDRALRLPASLRSILLMIDGQRDQAQLRELMAGLRAPDDAIEQLVVKGLIQRGDAAPSKVASIEVPAKAPVQASTAMPAGAPIETQAQAPAATLPALPGAINVPAEFGNYRRLYNFVADGVGRHLGLKGYFMQLKVERCADVDALLDLLPEVATALTKAKDHTFASEWLVRARAEVRS